MKIEQITDPSVLTEIFQQEFGSYPPSLKQGAVFALKVDDEIQAFITTEHLIRVGMMWINPKYRKSTWAGMILKRFFTFLFNLFPNNTSVVVIDDMGKNNRLLEGFGFRQEKGTVHRIDF